MQITNDHVEWAVVDRMRIMLEQPPHPTFNVTNTYALFATVLCWVMQRIRSRDNNSRDDQTAREVFEKLSNAEVKDDPWRIHVTPIRHRVLIGSASVWVPAPSNFEEHKVADFLINLRDATAHGDARKVSPFNVPVSREHLLVGFNFACEKFKERKSIWKGTITLLEDDMRRIGIQLARIYCDALREPHRGDCNFADDAGSILEAAE
jgi:hypothetical protein